MNICVLEHPRIKSKKHFNDIANTPLWSCLMGGYVVSSLKTTGFDVFHYDAATPCDSFQTVKEKILALKPDILMINAVYFWENTEVLFDFIKDLKQAGLNGHINLFGFFPTLAYQSILAKGKDVDSIAVGECENTLIELAKAVSKKDDITEIPGLAIRTAQKSVSLISRKPERNPDSFPFPERKIDSAISASILGSRGCYNHCSFCPVPPFYNQGPLWRGRTPENIFKEMAMLKEMGINDFYFVDPNFIGPGKKGKERTKKLLELIKPLNITFGMETRPEDIDEEIMDKLVDSGFTSLLLGVESGSFGVLDNLGKKTSAQISANAINICRKFNIEPEIGFLMFVPDSKLADIRQNMKFLEENKLLDRLERTCNLLSHKQIVLMGTSGYKMFEQQARIIKTGVFDFQGDIVYEDPVVKWLSDIIVTVCLHVLEKMEINTSPIYWNAVDLNKAQQVNDFLVKKMNNLIDEANKLTGYPDAETVSEGIINTINKLLNSQ